MMNGKIISYLKSRLEACHTDSVFCTGQGALDPFSAAAIWNLRQQQLCKGTAASTATTFAGQSHEIEWHVCLGDMSVQILRKLKACHVGKLSTNLKTFWTGSLTTSLSGTA